MRFNELRETLQLRLSGEFKRFADEELRAVPDAVGRSRHRVGAGVRSWVLLQRSVSNAYAQAVIRTCRRTSFNAAASWRSGS